MQVECKHGLGDYRKGQEVAANANVRNTEKSMRTIHLNIDILDPQWTGILAFLYPSGGTNCNVAVGESGSPMVYASEPAL